MKSRDISQLTDHALLHSFGELVARDRGTTSELVAQLAEIDLRKLHVPAGYPSMYKYCVRFWHMSEECAYKRIRVARAARRFPAILDALSDGRLHLSSLVILVSRLKQSNAEELLAAAERKTRAEVELLVAERFPKPDVPEVLRPVGASSPPSSGPTEPSTPTVSESSAQLSPGTVVPSREHDRTESAVPVPEPVAIPEASCPQTVARQEVAPHPRLTPLSPGRYALQVTVDQETYALIQEAKDLTGHQLPSRDTSEILKRALVTLVSQLRKHKYGETDSPRPRQSHANGRYVPAEIRREVVKRDGGRCTFIGDQGHRCEATSRLEFDHIHAVARGGQTNAGNLRLRCRAHNQLEAERVFGAGFMNNKRRVSAQPSSVPRDATPGTPARQPRSRAVPAVTAAVPTAVCSP